MMISHNHKFVFVSCPKTGTNTIYDALDKIGAKRWHGFHNREIPGRCRKYFIVGCVRNPYARAHSLWWSMLYSGSRFNKRVVGEVYDWGGDNNFDTWCAWQRQYAEDRHSLFANQVTWYRGIPITHLLRQETLEADFNSLPFVTDPIRLEKVNTSESKREGRPPLKLLLTPPVVDDINAWGDPDFDAFGYERIGVESTTPAALIDQISTLEMMA